MDQLDRLTYLESLPLSAGLDGIASGSAGEGMNGGAWAAQACLIVARQDIGAQPLCDALSSLNLSYLAAGRKASIETDFQAWVETVWGILQKIGWVIGTTETTRHVGQIPGLEEYLLNGAPDGPSLRASLAHLASSQARWRAFVPNSDTWSGAILGSVDESADGRTILNLNWGRAVLEAPLSAWLWFGGDIAVDVTQTTFILNEEVYGPLRAAIAAKLAAQRPLIPV